MQVLQPIFKVDCRVTVLILKQPPSNQGVSINANFIMFVNYAGGDISRVHEQRQQEGEHRLDFVPKAMLTNTCHDLTGVKQALD